MAAANPVPGTWLQAPATLPIWEPFTVAQDVERPEPPSEPPTLNDTVPRSHPPLSRVPSTPTNAGSVVSTSSSLTFRTQVFAASDGPHWLTSQPRLAMSRA